jgi:hypothetical protein
VRSGNNGGVRTEVADELLEFIRKGDLWEPDALRVLIASLESEGEVHGDTNCVLLAKPLAALLTRLEIGPVAERFADDIEGILYPRLWKVMEAVWDGLPEGELRTRVEVLNRRLSRRFVDEEPTQP